MQETSELRTVIESLYEIFATYPLRADTSACACCHSAYDEQRLHTKPFRKSTQTTCDSTPVMHFSYGAKWTISNISFHASLNWRLRTETASSISNCPNLMSWKSRTGFAVLLRPKPNCHRILESGLRRRRTMHA